MTGDQAPDALPSIETVLDKLREHAARPEWNVSLDHGELLVLFDHLDELQGRVADLDAIAERWWRLNVLHGPPGTPAPLYVARGRELQRLLNALPNPHRGDDHGK